MLPFLKNKESSIAIPEAIERKPDESEEKDDFDGLASAMEELHSALNEKDYSKAASIFRGASQLIDSEPHEEGEHV
jgi:hypothetical protein